MLIREAGLALMLLTRLPAGRIVGDAPVPAGSAVWAFPLVGALVGAVSGVVMLMGMPPLLGACWAVAAVVAVSGALHEDGLADMADGFGGGRDAARKLEIMRDSRIGSYGALALVLSTAIRVAAVAALAGRPGMLPGGLIAAGALSRGSMAVPLLLLGPARPGGSGALMAGAGLRRWVCLLLAAFVAMAAVPAGQAAAAFAASVLAGLGVSLLARAQIGGFTGDVLGGCAVAAECAGLTAMACA